MYVVLLEFTATSTGRAGVEDLWSPHLNMRLVPMVVSVEGRVLKIEVFVYGQPKA